MIVIIADEPIKSPKQRPLQPQVFTMNTNRDKFRESLPVDLSDFKKTGIVNYFERDEKGGRYETAQDREIRRSVTWLLSWFFTPTYEYRSQCLLQDLDTAIVETGNIVGTLSDKQMELLQDALCRDSVEHPVVLKSWGETPCVYCPNIERYDYQGAIIIGAQNTGLCEQLKRQVERENRKHQEFLAKYAHVINNKNE
jgi:hypothetical protein